MKLLMRFASNDLYRSRKAALKAGTVRVVDEPGCCQKQQYADYQAKKKVRASAPNIALGLFMFLVFIFVLAQR